MAISNHERVGKAMDLLKAGLAPFVEREFKNLYAGRALAEARRMQGDDRLLAHKKLAEWDATALLKLMWEAWNDVFRRTLGHAERSLVSELRDVRNKWAHQKPFSSDDAIARLTPPSACWLLSAPQARSSTRSRWSSLRRTVFDEQVRTEKRQTAGTPIESTAAGHLKPWREVVTPHQDVASGRYQQANSLPTSGRCIWAKARTNTGTQEFFRRTYLTESLKRLLVGAVQRLTGKVVTQWCSSKPTLAVAKRTRCWRSITSSPARRRRAGRRRHRAARGRGTALPSARRVVLVGNRISPGNPSPSPMARWYARCGVSWRGSSGVKKPLHVCAADENATSPGDVLRELFNTYGPCLILIDEWVAYARQLHDQGDLPTGTFRRSSPLPRPSPKRQRRRSTACWSSACRRRRRRRLHRADRHDENVEVGGQRGREALNSLRNVIGRVESSWRPAECGV